MTLLDRLGERKSSICGEIFNIGGGVNNSLSLLELIDILFSKTGNNPSYRFIKERQGDQHVYISDIRKAEKQLGWFPRVTKEDGISMMLEWINGL